MSFKSTVLFFVRYSTVVSLYCNLPVDKSQTIFAFCDGIGGGEEEGRGGQPLDFSLD